MRQLADLVETIERHSRKLSPSPPPPAGYSRLGTDGRWTANEDPDGTRAATSTLRDVRRLVARAKAAERAGRELHLRWSVAEQGRERLEHRLQIVETERNEAQALATAFREAIDWFCRRVELGEIRSGRTYERFRQLLGDDRGASLLYVVEAAKQLLTGDRSDRRAHPDSATRLDRLRDAVAALPTPGTDRRDGPDEDDYRRDSRILRRAS